MKIMAMPTVRKRFLPGGLIPLVDGKHYRIRPFTGDKLSTFHRRHISVGV
jgi:hypothetical protein